jgi:hypothetical protein
MAAHQAIIDLIVNGQNEVDRVIRSTDQLHAAIGRINSRPLELQPGRAQQSVERLTRSLQGIDRQVEQAAAHLTPLRNNFQAVSREAGTLDRALQRNSRSLEANRRQSQIYENTIRNAASGSVEFVNATAAGARAVVRNIRLTEQQTQLERRRAAVDARMTYQLRQMAGAETELAEAQERRGQAAASLGSARGFQVQIQFANRLASSYMDIAVSRERAEGTAQGARLPQFQSTAGLRSEIQFFDSLASSVATNTEAFKTFTIASRAASQSLAEVNRNRLAILAEAFTPDDPSGFFGAAPLEPGQRRSAQFERMRGTSGRQLSNQEVSRTRQEVDRLIASFDQVPRSEAGLEDYIQRLGDLRSIVTFTSSAYRQLTDQMARVESLRALAPTLKGQSSILPPEMRAGPASLIEAPESRLKRQTYYEKTKENILSRIVTFENNINEADLSQVQRTQLQIRLDEALLALAEDRLDVARRLTTEGEQARMSTERENRRNRITGGPMRAGGPGETVASIDAPRKVQEILRQTTTLQLYLNKLASEGIDVSLQQSAAQKLINELSAQGLQISDRFVKAKQSELAAIREITKQEKLRQTGGGLDPELLEGRVQRLLGRAIGLEGKAISLQEKGATSADQLRLEVQQKINALKQLEGNITSQNAESVASDLRLLLKSINEVSNALGEARNQVSQIAALTGFEGSFKKLQTSFGETGSFFQNVSPEQAIDKIVRQFTPSLTGTAGLASLNQLEKPAKLSSQKLNLLASSLQELAAQIDPLAPGAKKLLKAINRASASLQNEQAGRAPDADFLVRLTKNPRLAAGISEGLIGGAFPLLFGQGAGAAVLGGAGGFAGGMAGGALGFGLSLIGTAAGSAIDELGQKAITLGGALNKPSEAFDLLKEKSLFSSRELERAAQKMQDAGYAVAASISAQIELYKKIGPEGVSNLKNLETESDRLNRAFADLSVSVQAFIAGPLTELLSRMRGSTSARTLQQQAPGIAKDLRDAGLTDYAEGFSQRITKILTSPDLVLGLDPGGAAEKLQAEIDAANFLLKPAIEFNIDSDQIKKEAQDALQGISSALSQQLELIDIGKNLSNQYRNVAREQEDIIAQRQDIEKSYLESIGDIRLGIERTVQKEALDGIRTQNELLKIQGETRLQQFRNATAELVSAQGADEYGRRLFEILGRAGEIELSTQQEIENRKRDLELDLQSRAIETEIYKGDIAKQVARLNESTAKSIADINKSVRRANEDYDERRFGIEREIAKSRLAIIKSETEQTLANAREAEARYKTAIESGTLPQAQAEALLTATGNLRVYISALEGQQKALDAAARQVAGAQPPPRKAEVAAVSTSGVSFAAYDAIRERAVAAAKAIAEANEGLVQLARQGNWQKVKEELLDLADQGFARASSELNVFVQRYKEFAAGRIGDEFSAPLEQLEQKIKDFEAFKRLEATENTSKMMEAFVGAGMNREQIEFFVELGLQTTKLSEAQLQGVRTTGFYTDSISSLSQEVESLSAELLKATEFGSEYEKAMASLVRRGLDPAAEASKAFLAEAEKLDILKQKIAIVEGLAFASDTLSGSLKDLVKQFTELGSASEAVKKVSENIAKASMDFVLDLAFKPVEESMRKTMLDMATKLGFDISTPQERQLQNLVDINNTTASIKDIIQKFVSEIMANQPAIAPSPANQIVPGPGYSSQDLPQSQRTDYWDPAWGPVPLDRRPRVGQQVGPQSSLPGAFSGMGGSNDQAYEIFKVKTEQWVLGIALETYEKLGTVFDKTIREIQTVPELETYKKNQFSLIENFLNGMPAEARPAMALDITSIIEAAAARRASEIGSGDISVGSTTEISRGLGQVPAGANAAVYAMELSRALPEVEKAFSATTFSIAEGNTKLSTITPQWTKNLGQAVTGLGMAASAVVGIIGGIQNIRQGGAGNIFTGIGSILTTIGGIGMSAAGFMKPSMPGGGFGAPAGADFLGGASALPSSFKFADGGILQSPTLFNFEDAGVTRTGQAGEAGAEAIMPLKRTKDGRLGVEADLSVPFEGGSIMLDEEPATGASGASSIPFRSRSGVDGQQSLSIPFLKGGGLLGADGGDSTDTIRFESTVINGVEFVTRDEAEEIGRRSETRGAARGAELAHRRIRNNPQTRRSIGMQ